MGENKNLDEKINFYRTVEIATLLHDIGKFAFRANSTDRKKHESYSVEFLRKINLPAKIDKNKVIELVENHHNSNKVFGGLNELRFSDWISAGMDREESKEDDPFRPLNTVFSSISLKDTAQNQVKKSFNLKKNQAYKPLALNETNINDAIFPQKSDDIAKVFSSLVSDSWKEFTHKMSLIPENLAFNSWIKIVNSLLFCYTTNIPSSAYKTKANVSLYNHLVSSAAIARCMIEYNEHVPIGKQDDGGADEKRYLIISGDINGIQSFIFKTRFPAKARKNSSARLRGKSFFLELLSDAIISYILEALSLDVNNILTFAAGNFKILAPNTKLNKEKINMISVELSNYLYKNYGLDLGVTLVWTEASNNDLRDYAELEKKVGKSVERTKYSKKKELLFENKGELLVTDKTLKFFEEVEPAIQKKKCIVCEKHVDLSSQSDFCINCLDHQEIGKSLPKTKAIVRIEKEKTKNLQIPKLYSIEILKYRYYFVEIKIIELLTKIGKTETTVFFSDFKELTNDVNISSLGIRFFNFNLSMPKKDHKLLSFDYLSEVSSGIKRLGILKADVDNLGTIFTAGLMSSEDEKKTLSKLRDLSTRLELFFGYYTSIIAQKPQYRIWFKICDKHQDHFTKIETEDEENNKQTFYRYNVENDKKGDVLLCKTCNNSLNYTNSIYGLFSGGDDFVFIGPWDIIIDFALDVNNEFKQYISNNPWITISAGIVLSETSYPISRSLVKAESALEESKNFLKSVDSSFCLKNSVTIFDETLLWKREDDIYITHEKDKRLGDFQYLLSCAKEISKEEGKDDKTSRRFIHLLLELWENTFNGMNREDIQLHRTSKIDYYPILAYQIARRYPKDPKLKNEKFNFYSKILPWMKFPATWALYKNKKRR